MRISRRKKRVAWSVAELEAAWVPPWALSSAGVFFARPLVGSRWTAGQGPLAQKTPTLLNLHLRASCAATSSAGGVSRLARDGDLLQSNSECRGPQALGDRARFVELLRMVGASESGEHAGVIGERHRAFVVES